MKRELITKGQTIVAFGIMCEVHDGEDESGLLVVVDEDGSLTEIHVSEIDFIHGGKN